MYYRDVQILSRTTVRTVGFFIFTRSLKFNGGRVVSHYFDHAESNGVKIFKIKKYLGVANRPQSFGFLTKKRQNVRFLTHGSASIHTSIYHRMCPFQLF